MTRRPPRFVLLLAVLLAFTAAALPLAGCGSEEPETDVPEGEPLELGELEFDVQITRFLNPDAPDDSNYLEGAPSAGEDQQYLAVFMEIANEGEEPNVVPYPFKIVDTRGEITLQTEVDNPFSLVAGTPILPDQAVPGAETPAANGPIEGAALLFLLDETANENRPLKLVVPGPTGPGEVELDL
ncbi:MAG: hypothetical protein M3Q53_04950 [Actinomycetota bacterium]|nr:hypothetical protein [Actinomycetota bacterium]